MIQDNPITTIKIDLWSILKVILVLCLFFFLYVIKDIILFVLIAVFLSIVIIPIVDFFEKKIFFRWLGALIVYLIIFGALVFFGFLFFPTLISESQILFEKMPGYLKSIFGEEVIFWSSGIVETLKNWLMTSGAARSQIFSFFSDVVGGLFTTLIILVISFYLSIDKNFIIRQINKFLPLKYKDFLTNFYQASQKRISAWALASLMLCLIIGILSYFGLLILGIKFALLLGVMAGVFEIIPYLGPWLGGSMAFIVALADSPTKALMVVIFYVILQQLENSFFAPQIMKKAVGINPVVVLIALMVGGKLAGLLGVLLAIPLITVGSILVKDYLETRSESLK